ncbi:response regulator transcription factor [Streptomyces chartreusis]|uniref:response regulator transcription factor n=1 Tax=Streptomyces chartreusis TaxID=1969 RepID=UPI0038053272
MSSSAEMITVKLHADDIITRVGLSSCLAQFDGFSELGPAVEDSPDVYIVATGDSDANTLRLLESLSPTAKDRFILIVDNKWQTDVYAAVEKGVRAMLWRSSFSSSHLAQTIKAVVSGAGLFPPGLQGALMQQVQQVHRDVLAPRGLTALTFSDREIKVLRLLSEGLDLDQISQRIQYSERTVKNILYSAMKRHQFRNRTQAVAHAIRSGLI